jgi:hypothetical protein
MLLHVARALLWLRLVNATAGGVTACPRAAGCCLAPCAHAGHGCQVFCSLAGVIFPGTCHCMNRIMHTTALQQCEPTTASALEALKVAFTCVADTVCTVAWLGSSIGRRQLAVCSNRVACHAGVTHHILYRLELLYRRVVCYGRLFVFLHVVIVQHNEAGSVLIISWQLQPRIMCGQTA